MDNLEQFAIWAQAALSGALVILTYYLAKETRRLADVSLPNVIAKITPNTEFAGTFELNIVNCGGSPAYDVQINFEPTLPVETWLQAVSPRPTSFGVILPGEKIGFHAGSKDEIMKVPEFKIAMSWRKKFNSTLRKTRNYTQYTSSFEGTVESAKPSKEK